MKECATLTWLKKMLPKLDEGSAWRDAYTLLIGSFSQSAEADGEAERPLTLIYICNDCSIEWEEGHDCPCNDRCPMCNREIEPAEMIDWSEIEPCS